MIIRRDYDRTENDDFKIRVEPHMNRYQEAMPLRDEHGDVVAWKIQGRYE